MNLTSTPATTDAAAAYDEFEALLASVESGAVAPLRGSGLLELYEPEGGLDTQIKAQLQDLDDVLLTALESGHIRLVRVEWLLLQPAEYQIQCRQQLEALDGTTPSPLMRPEEAAKLVRRGNRAAGALTYGWASPGSPDPNGARIQILRRALVQFSHIEGFFWECAACPRISHQLFAIWLLSTCIVCPRSFASLYQGQKTEQQQEAFRRALAAMGHLYASAIGTTVLQLKEIPPRPAEFDGALCLFDLEDGVDEPVIRARLQGFGQITSVTLGTFPPAVVRFSTHESALAAKRAAAELTELCAGIDTLYNEQSYDGRKGEAGRDDDDGRGW